MTEIEDMIWYEEGDCAYLRIKAGGKGEGAWTTYRVRPSLLKYTVVETVKIALPIRLNGSPISPGIEQKNMKTPVGKSVYRPMTGDGQSLANGRATASR